MKKSILSSLTFAICILVQLLSVSAVEIKEIDSNHYYTLTSKAKSNFHYKQYISNQYLTVLTLKHVEGNADYDVRVYSDNNFQNLVGTSQSSGISNELIVLPWLETSQYMFFRVNNCNDEYAKYELYVDYINVGELFGEALAISGLEYVAEEFIKAIFGIDNESREGDRDMASRAAVSFVSSLQGKSLAETSKTVIINDIRRDFGGEGFVSSLMVNFGTAFIEKVYQRY